MTRDRTPDNYRGASPHASGASNGLPGLVASDDAANIGLDTMLARQELGPTSHLDGSRKPSRAPSSEPSSTADAINIVNPLPITRSGGLSPISTTYERISDGP